MPWITGLLAGFVVIAVADIRTSAKHWAVIGMLSAVLILMARQRNGI